MKLTVYVGGVACAGPLRRGRLGSRGADLSSDHLRHRVRVAVLRKRRWRIVGEELEPAEQELIEEAATRVLRGESLRSIAMDWNKRGVKTVGGGTWQGSMIRRVLMSPRIAGLKRASRRDRRRGHVASDHRPRHP
jgi:hypothetical protein